LFAIVAGTLVLGVGAGVALTRTPGSFTYPQSTAPTNNPVILQPTNTAPCSWHDTPFEGIDAAERAHLSLVDACGKVTGVVQEVVKVVEDEKTTYHFTILPDAQYASMVNAQNTAKAGGALIVEIEAADAGIMPRLHLGQHLSVEGPLVTDTDPDHGWNEIHPAKVIREL